MKDKGVPGWLENRILHTLPEEQENQGGGGGIPNRPGLGKREDPEVLKARKDVYMRAFRNKIEETFATHPWPTPNGDILEVDYVHFFEDSDLKDLKRLKGQASFDQLFERARVEGIIQFVDSKGEPVTGSGLPKYIKILKTLPESLRQDK